MTIPFTTFAFPATGGSANRTMPDRISDVYNVRDYGALGNSTGDDRAAIQAAINAVGTSRSNRGVIFFPPGTYPIGAALDISGVSSITLRGCGNASNVGGTFHGFIIDGRTDPYASGASNGVRIEDLSLTNNFVGQNYSTTSTSAWTVGSGKTILTPGVNTEITTSCLVYILDQWIAPMPVFVGVATSVSSGASITLDAARASFAAVNVTGAANNGGSIRLTVSSVVDFHVGMAITITSVGGISAANGTHTITAVGASTIDIDVTWPGGSYTSGGTIAINLNLALCQAYASTGTWTANVSTTITMSVTKPAGAPSGQCLVYDYDRMLYGDGTIPDTYLSALGVGTWSGTTVTFLHPVNQANGATNARLVFAPLAGCIRMSTTVMGSISQCDLRGFIGVTTSQDGASATGQYLGEQAYAIITEKCNLSAAPHSAAIGSMAIYNNNNSISFYNEFSAWWMGYRASGIGNSMLGGRVETCTYGIVTSSTPDTGNNINAAGIFAGFSMESCKYGVIHSGSSCTFQNINILCQNSNGQYGFINYGGRTVIQASSIQGNWAGYAVRQTNTFGNNRGQVRFQETTAANNYGGGLGHWSLPVEAWWGTCEGCNNPALVYTYANLPSGSPAPFEGETYDISNCSTSTFLATAAPGGTGATAHRRVRWNAASSIWQVVG